MIIFENIWFFFLMIRRPPRSTQSRSSAASDVYKRQLRDPPVAIETGEARPEDGEREAGDCLVATQSHTDEGMDGRRRCCCCHAQQQADIGIAGLHGSEEPEERANQHQSLEPEI